MLAIRTFGKHRLRSQGKLAITSPMNDPKQRAIEGAGGLMALAEKLGISYQAIQQWPQIPDKWLLKVEAASGIPREELRPELYRTPAKRKAESRPQ